MPYRLPAGAVRLPGRQIVPEGGFLLTNPDQPFEIGDVVVRRGQLRHLSEQTKADLGLVWEDPVPQPAPPPRQPTAADVQAEAARRLLVIGEPYSREERETWAAQVQEAKALLADPAADPAVVAPFLNNRAVGRGATPSDLAAVVLAKNTAYSQAAGDIMSAQDVLLAMDPIPQDFRNDSHWLPSDVDQPPS